MDFGSKDKKDDELWNYLLAENSEKKSITSDRPNSISEIFHDFDSIISNEDPL